MTKPRRNELCGCGSEKKYKRCCGKRLEERRTAIRQEAWRRYREPYVAPQDDTDTRTDEQILEDGANFDRELAEDPT